LNSEHDISALYNSLFQLEAKFKQDSVYPIHKRLFLENGMTDIYEYLIAKVNIKEKKVLDAGCGVGFGSFLFLKNGAIEVTGISLSDEEIKRANEMKKALGFENATFEKATFDAVSHPYDVIFCVESLKHSLNIEKSFSTLLDNLNDNGKIVIVDDFFNGDENSISNSLNKNWHLNELIAENHLQFDTAKFSIESEDLTKFMKLKSYFKIYFQLMFFSIFKKNSSYRKLFKGGILLDYLYTKKQMHYKLFIITKK
jgi:cyclopropane fatty-acyl-phospholipid synthase-like methyltransferase